MNQPAPRFQNNINGTFISPSTPKKNFFSNSPNKNLLKENTFKGTKLNYKHSLTTKTGNIKQSLNKGNTSAQSKGKLKKNLKIKRVLSLSQILGRIRIQRKKKVEQQKRQKPIKPIIPPKSLIIILKDKPEKAVYNRRIIDYKHCGLLQRYIGLGGKILPRRQTRLTAKQQRYVAKTIKSARIMGLLPFVSKERGFFR
uniref:Small ribosomal subunit protein bS18c n=1 Tax=Chlamydomonas nivalis TaxID=47906 RepID=A0A0S2IBJ8_9CHLO|nr:ribosomal protein S18 [Chlamydomonas nivalis]